MSRVAGIKELIRVLEMLPEDTALRSFNVQTHFVTNEVMTVELNMEFYANPNFTNEFLNPRAIGVDLSDGPDKVSVVTRRGRVLTHDK